MDEFHRSFQQVKYLKYCVSQEFLNRLQRFCAADENVCIRSIGDYCDLVRTVLVVKVRKCERDSVASSLETGDSDVREAIEQFKFLRVNSL